MAKCCDNPTVLLDFSIARCITEVFFAAIATPVSIITGFFTGGCMSIVSYRIVPQCGNVFFLVFAALGAGIGLYALCSAGGFLGDLTLVPAVRTDGRCRGLRLFRGRRLGRLGVAADSAFALAVKGAVFGLLVAAAAGGGVRAVAVGFPVREAVRMGGRSAADRHQTSAGIGGNVVSAVLVVLGKVVAAAPVVDRLVIAV